MHILLATLLQVLSSRREMSILISDWLHTSNDVLRGLMSKHGVPALVLVAAPSAEAVQNVESAPPRVIGPDLPAPVYLERSSSVLFLWR
jgi:hypothetical protein